MWWLAHVYEARSRPRLLVDAPPGLINSGPIGSLDVSPADGRFVGLWRAEVEPQPATRIEVVQNWFEELKRLAPTE